MLEVSNILCLTFETTYLASDNMENGRDWWAVCTTAAAWMLINYSFLGGCHSPGSVMLLGYFSAAGPEMNLDKFIEIGFHFKRIKLTEM